MSFRARSHRGTPCDELLHRRFIPLNELPSLGEASCLCSACERSFSTCHSTRSDTILDTFLYFSIPSSARRLTGVAYICEHGLTAQTSSTMFQPFDQYPSPGFYRSSPRSSSEYLPCSEACSSAVLYTCNIKLSRQERMPWTSCDVPETGLVKLGHRHGAMRQIS